MHILSCIYLGSHPYGFRWYVSSRYLQKALNLCDIFVKQIFRQRKAFCKQRTTKSSCLMKETVDIDILITKRNDDKKNLAIIQITSVPSSKRQEARSSNWPYTFVLVMDRLIHFYINSTTAEWSLKQNWFIPHWNKQGTFCPSSQRLVGHIQFKKL